MTTLPLTRRFQTIVLACFLVALLGAGCAIWRDASHRDNRADSAEAEMRLELAVRSLREQPEGASAVPAGPSSALFDKLGADDKVRRRIMDQLGVIETKLAELRSAGRIKGVYRLDLEQLAGSVELARKEERPLYGSVGETVLGALRLLGQGRTLKLLVWREDIPAPARPGSLYWSQHAAKLPEGFLALKNPWGPVPGTLLVEGAIPGREPGAKPELLRVCGQDANLSDGQRHAEVRRFFPGFELSGEPALAESLKCFLDYGAAASLVDRKNLVQIGGRGVPSGYDPVLTLDPALQSIAAQLTENALEGGFAKNATLVAMDLNSGGILSGSGAAAGSGGRQNRVPLVFREILPASTVKIIFSSAMLEQSEHFTQSEAGKKMLAQLPYYLMKSDPTRTYFPTAAFDYGGAALFKRQAESFGWNEGCPDSEQSSGSCGRTSLDFLFGSSLQGLSLNYPLTGRIFLRSGKHGEFEALTPRELEGLPPFALLARNPEARPDGYSQASYDTAKLVRQSMFGQGDVRSSSFGLLHTIAHVANAANGRVDTPLPHLVLRVLASDGRTVPTPAPARVPVALKPANALILAGYLTAVNSREGTAGEPFKKVFGRYPLQPARELLFAKTGTTDSSRKGVPALSLYLAAYSRGGREYDTAVVAVIEREDLRGSYNRAADLALRFIKATRPEPR